MSVPELHRAICWENLLCQSGDTLLPDPPHLLEAPTPDDLCIVVDPGLHVLAVQGDFVGPNLLGNDRFFIQKLGDRFRGLRAGSCDVDAPPRIRQVAVGFWERRQAIPGQDRAYPWSIALVHVIDAQREDDWEVLLVREGREEGMFGAACPFPFAQDSLEIRSIHGSPVR